MIEASIGGRYTISKLSGEGEHLTPLAWAKLEEEDSKRTERRFLPSAALLAPCHAMHRAIALAARRCIG